MQILISSMFNFSDLTNTSSFDEISSQISNIVGNQGLNLLINNAGVTTKFTKLSFVKAEQLLDNLTINTIAPIMLTKVRYNYHVCCLLIIITKLKLN